MRAASAGARAEPLPAPRGSRPDRLPPERAAGARRRRGKPMRPRVFPKATDGGAGRQPRPGAFPRHYLMPGAASRRPFGSPTTTPDAQPPAALEDFPVERSWWTRRRRAPLAADRKELAPKRPDARGTSAAERCCPTAPDAALAKALARVPRTRSEQLILLVSWPRSGLTPAFSCRGLSHLSSRC